MALTRRAFLRAAGLGTAGLALATWAEEVAARPRWLGGVLGQDAVPDLIYYNANVLTMDAVQPRAEAVAIAGERLACRVRWCTARMANSPARSAG